MGRRSKPLRNKKILDKRELGYYSTPSFVADFLTKAMLDINADGVHVLDPAVGNEELLNLFHKKKKKIDGIDIYKHRECKLCRFHQGDFIDIYRRKKRATIFGESINLPYDYYIFNPPFNDHEVTYIKENKDELIKLFGRIGAYNMSSMYLSAIMDSAKEGALIGFIIADGFLTSNSYQPVREQILKTCSIHYLLLCPVDLFAEQKTKVRTCIMILRKGTQYQGKVKSLNRPDNTDEFKTILKRNEFNQSDLNKLISNSTQQGNEFVIGIPPEIQQLFSNPRIGDLFKCLSGISTGNDAIFISPTKKPGYEIPFYKNIYSKRFYCEPDRYLTNQYAKYAIQNKNFILRNKDNIFREGIVCSQVGLSFSACFKPKGAVFGMNAGIFCPKKDMWWLMAYLNSSLVTYLLRAVINRSYTVSSGYVAKIPVISLTRSAKKKLGVIAQQAFKSQTQPSDVKPVIQEIDSILFKSAKLSRATEKEILHFASNLLKRV